MSTDTKESLTTYCKDGKFTIVRDNTVQAIDANTIGTNTIASNSVLRPSTATTLDVGLNKDIHYISTVQSNLFIRDIRTKDNKSVGSFDKAKYIYITESAFSKKVHTGDTCLFEDARIPDCFVFNVGTYITLQVIEYNAIGTSDPLSLNSFKPYEDDYATTTKLQDEVDRLNRLYHYHTNTTDTLISLLRKLDMELDDKGNLVILANSEMSTQSLGEIKNPSYAIDFNKLLRTILDIRGE